MLPPQLVEDEEDGEDGGRQEDQYNTTQHKAEGSSPQAHRPPAHLTHYRPSATQQTMQLQSLEPQRIRCNQALAVKKTGLSQTIAYTIRM